MSNISLVGKYILKGTIELRSPLIIGSGDDKELDIEIVKDEKGKPFIPA
jgi:CRISPR/Cas system CSM-associated protein Csm3 (group 7 of RAMP superfamily)